MDRFGGSIAPIMNNDNSTLHARVDVGQLLDTGRFVGLPLLVATFTALTLVFDGFDIQAIAFAAPALMADWGMERAALAPVLAAGLLGMGLGGLVGGALGDRIGRRGALIGSMALVSAASLLSAFAESPTELLLWRLLTGIGLGGTLPNAAALISEFAPRNVRTMAVTTTVVGVPVGGMLGALVAAELIPAFGWRSIFIAGAILPGVLVVAMLFLLPESARFLTARSPRKAQLAKLLNRLVGTQQFTGAESFYLVEPQQVPGRTGVGVLFTPEFRRETLIVWLIFLTNVFVVYAIFNWLPTVLSAAGLPLTTAIRGSLVFNLGGVLGSLAGAVFITRLGSRSVLTFFGAVAVVSTFVVGWIPLAGRGGVAQLLMTMAICGACISGMQVGMYSVAAHIYPTVSRASGLGWALGIARFGGILSSFAGSILLALGDGTRSFFTGMAAVLLLTLTGVLLLKRHIPALR
jgi:AAHS family 4-hydroxybenzoate transporter-like MFS transporter